MNAYLLPGLTFGPRIVERMVKQIPAARHDEKTNPDRFTLREAVAHLSDWEPILRERMEQAVKNPGSAVTGIDEAQRADELNYGQTDVFQELRRFASEREKTIAFYKGLSPEEKKRTVVHNEKGEQSVEDQANQLLGHDLYHIDHLTEFFGGKVAGTW